MTNVFDKISKKACNLIFMEDDLIAVVKTLETYRLNKKMTVSTGNNAKRMVVNFKSAYSKWGQLTNDLKKACKSKVTTAITDQFGKTHYIELA